MAVKAKRKPEILLQQIAHIQDMERGKLCRMRRGAKGDYYNHQTWEKGRNVVRYGPQEQVAPLKEAIAGYQQFLKLIPMSRPLISSLVSPQLRVKRLRVPIC